MTPSELSVAAALAVAEIRAKRSGFGGGTGGDESGTGAAWYDSFVYPLDTYPAIATQWFESLEGGRLVGPGWRAYPSQAHADADAVEAAMRLGRSPFVPTHRLAEDIPELKLRKGEPVRQLNPFAGERALDQLLCATAADWYGRRQPWIFVPANLEPLPEWPSERRRMIDAITRKGK